MSIGIIILIFLGLALVVLMVWNLITIRNEKNKHDTSKKLDDQKYYELKYKQEYFVAVVSFIGTALIILGYNNIDSVKSALSAEFAKKTDSTNMKMTIISRRSDSLINAFDSSARYKLNETNSKLALIQQNSNALASATANKLKSTQASVSSYINLLQNLALQQSDIEKRNISSEKQIKNVISRIEELNNKNILKQNYYIIDSLIFDIDKNFMASTDEGQYATYYFKDMHTTIGDKLPKFNTPPFILYFTDSNGGSGRFKNVTTESFKFKFETFMDVEGTPHRLLFKILISEL